MNVSSLTMRLFGTNVYILWNAETHHAIVVDPGMMDEQERHLVTDFLSQRQLVVQHVLLTHAHIDHAFSAHWLAQRCGVPVEGSSGEAMLASALPQQAEFFHLDLDVAPLKVGHELHDGDIIMLDDEEIHVIAVPGHSPGGLAFYVPQCGFALTGDSLFRGSIGRTDFWGGDLPTLLRSIRTRLLTLPPDTMLYPGHEASTTVEQEKLHNPYLR